MKKSLQTPHWFLTFYLYCGDIHDNNKKNRDYIIAESNFKREEENPNNKNQEI
jgi:hypothetical protein